MSVEMQEVWDEEDEHRLVYCYRNRVVNCAEGIKRELAEEGVTVETVVAPCMKLCFLCPVRPVVVLDRQVIVSRDEEELRKRIGESVGVTMKAQG